MPMGEPKCPGCGGEIVSGVAHSCNRLVCPDCDGLRHRLAEANTAYQVMLEDRVKWVKELKAEIGSLHMLLEQAISSIHLFRNHKATSLEACDDVACQKVVKALARTAPLCRCACGSGPGEGHADTCTYF